MTQRHMQDQVGKERFAAIALLADLQSQLADINREFVTSGGDLSRAAGLIVDMRRTLDALGGE